MEPQVPQVVVIEMNIASALTMSVVLGVFVLAGFALFAVLFGRSVAASLGLLGNRFDTFAATIDRASSSQQEVARSIVASNQGVRDFVTEVRAWQHARA